LHCLLGGGDDYELCFTAPVARREQVQAVARALALPLSRVGTVEREVGLRIRDERGDALVFSGHSFDHFAS
jgi:thiamine-monophosphate kinase